MSISVEHDCSYPASGCTSANCAITEARHDQRVIEALMRVAADQAITCTGPGEVGCRVRIDWHTPTEHRRHVAEAQLAELRRVGLVLSEVQR